MSYEFAIRQGTRRESLTHNSNSKTHNSHSYSQLTIQNLKTQKKTKKRYEKCELETGIEGVNRSAHCHCRVDRRGELRELILNYELWIQSYE